LQRDTGVNNKFSANFENRLSALLAQQLQKQAGVHPSVENAGNSQLMGYSG
jgi:hypothetical protein